MSRLAFFARNPKRALVGLTMPSSPKVSSAWATASGPSYTASPAKPRARANTPALLWDPA